MSAVLIVVAGRYGLEGVWLTGVLAGLMIILMGVLKWGQVINFIPSAVITGFTSGIAVIIFIGQIGNLLGIDTPSAENAWCSCGGTWSCSRRPTGRRWVSACWSS